jgi:hypothetical protein
MSIVLTPSPTSVLEAAALLLAAASRGVHVFLANDRLRVRPANGLTPEERAILRSLRDQGPAISRELCWRVEAMRPHVPPSPAPIPGLLARPNVHQQTGVCFSCGETVLESAVGRCPLCALAAWIALAAYETRVLG